MLVIIQFTLLWQINQVSCFVQAVELGIALLEGGHQDIQKSLYMLLTCGDLSQSFFHVFHEKINDAQVKNVILKLISRLIAILIW